tara:strand:+ start:3688 stop:4038 length:351 start_codon:yes stop_codon:yes gene_type:complete
MDFALISLTVAYPLLIGFVAYLINSLHSRQVSVMTEVMEAQARRADKLNQKISTILQDSLDKLAAKDFTAYMASRDPREGSIRDRIRTSQEAIVEGDVYEDPFAAHEETPLGPINA